MGAHVRGETPWPVFCLVQVAFAVAFICLQGLFRLETLGHYHDSSYDIDAPRYDEKTKPHPDPADLSMTYITLTYGTKSEKYSQRILHNCLMINQAKGDNTFTIFTDQPEGKEYCKHCNCEKFELYNCKCPNESCVDGTKNACEKNHFFSDVMLRYPEFIFLDHDLVVLKPSFFEALHDRTRHHDFLAARDQGPSIDTYTTKHFNSGLVFIRRLPDVDPMLLREILYEKPKRNYDQVTLSKFVQRYYKNWDELSIKWHCRALPAYHSDVPLEHCYTLHPPYPDQLKELNFTYLTLP